MVISLASRSWASRARSCSRRRIEVRMKGTRHIIALAVLVGASFAGSRALAWDQTPFAMYFQRTDKTTLGAGNAKAVNAATHIIDPWPRYVGNRRIPGNGDRLSRAVERYRLGSYRQPAPPIAPYPAGGYAVGGARRR